MYKSVFFSHWVVADEFKEMPQITGNKIDEFGIPVSSSYNPCTDWFSLSSENRMCIGRAAIQIKSALQDYFFC